MIEVYEVKGGRRPGWRFRMLNQQGESVFSSNGSYEDEAEARRVAKVINTTMWQGSHKVRTARQ